MTPQRVVESGAYHGDPLRIAARIRPKHDIGKIELCATLNIIRFRRSLMRSVSAHAVTLPVGQILS